jgi:hypothetical protein
LYSVVNEEGFIEVPAVKVAREVKPIKDQLLNKIAENDIFELDAKGNPTKKCIVKDGEYIDEKKADLIEKHYKKI